MGDTVYVTDEMTYLTTSTTDAEVYTFNVTASVLVGGVGVSGDKITITAYLVVPASN